MRWAPRHLTQRAAGSAEAVLLEKRAFRAFPLPGLQHTPAKAKTWDLHDVRVAHRIPVVGQQLLTIHLPAQQHIAPAGREYNTTVGMLPVRQVPRS